MKRKETISRFKWCWNSFCVIFLYKKNLVRDLAILGMLSVSLGTILIIGWYIGQRMLDNNFEQYSAAVKELTEEEKAQNEIRSVSDIQSHFDTSVWIPYQNTWYGFTLRYPDGWLDPTVRKPIPGVLWDQKIEFRTQQADEFSPFEGFDVIVYDVSKVEELSNTYEFPKIKSVEFFSRGECVNIEGHLLETGDYPAEEIYIPADDACYNAALFFTNTRDGYIYTIVPKIKDGSGLAGDPSEEIKTHLPEFFSSASTWDLIDIRRPRPVSQKQKITAPMPVSHIVVGGRNVCAKPDDRPGKSNQGKKKHLDMECCLDPDEYPNPHCYYDPGRYGKYL